MTLWDRILAFKTANAQQLVYTSIPVAQTDVPAGPPIVANEGYLRVYLSDMFLTRSRDWFTDWHPCVSTAVRLQLGGQPGQTITHVARPPQDALAPGARVNYAATDLLPFAGGLVEIESALVALQGKAYIDAALGVLASFSGLIPGPIASAIGIAEKISAGLEDLIGAVDGQVHLGFHDTFASAGGNNQLEPGYLAIVKATAAQVNPTRLGVRAKRLHYYDDQSTWVPLSGYDYMLYYIEARTQRDDWRLPSIQTALDKAIEQTVLGDNADAYRKAALIAALTCKELTPLDRRRVAQAIKEEIAAASAAGMGAVGDGVPLLEAVVARRGPSPGTARAGRVPSEAEILE
jgi:hypothetical protein